MYVGYIKSSLPTNWLTTAVVSWSTYAASHLPLLVTLGDFGKKQISTEKSYL